MGGVGVRVDEQLDHQGHAQQRQGAEARGQAHQDQQREKMLGEGRQVRRQFRSQYRQVVLALEQGNGRIRQAWPAQLEGSGNQVDGQSFDLGLPGFPEHRGNTEARDEGHQAVGDEFQFLAGPHQQVGDRGVGPGIHDRSSSAVTSQ